MNFGSIIHDVLRAKYPGCEYVAGETYESLQWLCEQPKPTAEQLAIDIADYTANRQSYDYKQLRIAAYPSAHERLMMLWHAMDTNEIPKATEFYNAIKNVNDTYPEPEE